MANVPITKFAANAAFDGNAPGVAKLIRISSERIRWR